MKRREYNDGEPKYQIEIVTIGRLLFFFQEYKCDLKTVPLFFGTTFLENCGPVSLK